MLIHYLSSLFLTSFPVYCESWTLTAELQRRIQAMEMTCYPQYTTHLIQRPCYQRGSPCQDPAANRTTRRPPDHRKETQTAVTWSCLPFIRSGQNNLARHSERGKKTRQTKEEVGKQTSGNGEAWSSAIPEGSGEQRKREETGCEIICGALTTLAVKE